MFLSLQPSAFEEKAIEKVDDLLESYMGIRDSELGMRVASAGVRISLSLTVLCSLYKCPLTSLRLPQRPPWWSWERTKRTRMSSPRL